MDYKTTREEVVNLLEPYHYNILWQMDGPPNTGVRRMEAVTLYRPDEMGDAARELIGMVIIQYFAKGGCAFYYDENCINPMLGMPLDNRIETSGALIRGMATKLAVFSL